MFMFTAEFWSVAKDIGVGAISVVALYLLYKVFILFIEQWGKSTEAINRNTETHKEMQDIFNKSYEREIEFQKEVIIILKDTHRRVVDMHENNTK